MKFDLTVTDGDKQYTISLSKFPNYDFWLCNDSGEGMSVSEKNLFRILDEYFKKEF